MHQDIIFYFYYKTHKVKTLLLRIKQKLKGKQQLCTQHKFHMKNITIENTQQYIVGWFVLWNQNF